MESPHIPQDDLMDVMEMTNNLEKFISEMLGGNNVNLAISALMSATTNCLLSQCKTFDDVLFYRNLFVQILDSSIRQIEVKGKDFPASS